MKTKSALMLALVLCAFPIIAIAQNFQNANVHMRSGWIQAADATSADGSDTTFKCKGTAGADTSAIYTLGGLYKQVFLGSRLLYKNGGVDSVDAFLVLQLSYDGTTWGREDSTAKISDSLRHITAIDVRCAQKFRIILQGVTGNGTADSCTSGGIWFNFRQG